MGIRKFWSVALPFGKVAYAVNFVPPTNTVNKITWSRYVTLDLFISSAVLPGGASEALMLHP